MTGGVLGLSAVTVDERNSKEKERQRKGITKAAVGKEKIAKKRDNDRGLTGGSSWLV